uniref:Uncharacterized protein n=1 Tax=viral metagenome TaxID=1070528 RepID=A0A6M3LV90_9ZZZZ
MSIKKERKKKHGLSKTPFYKTWQNMKHRCFYPSDKKYKYYGGRGIIVCDKWLDFLNFKNDMYESYLKHKAIYETTTIERLNSNGNYCLENCCWETQEEQKKMNLPNKIDKKNMKVVTLMITDKQHNDIKALNVNMSAFIRQAIGY